MKNTYPPYGTGGTLYLRPLLIGVGDIIGVKPAEEYIFTIFAMPVGNYFKGGLVPTNFLIQDEYDRAAPKEQELPRSVATMQPVFYRENG